MSGKHVSANAPNNPLQAGKTLAPRAVTTLDGRSVQLAAPAKGYLILYVWSTWYCAYQRDAASEITGLHQRFKDRGVAMIGISTDYRREDLIEYVRAHSIAFPQVFNGPDLSEGLLADIGVDRSPLAILVDDRGRVVSVGKRADELTTFLDTALAKRR